LAAPHVIHIGTVVNKSEFNEVENFVYKNLEVRFKVFQHFSKIIIFRAPMVLKFFDTDAKIPF